jgi:hypothetical protein
MFVISCRLETSLNVLPFSAINATYYKQLNMPSASILKRLEINWVFMRENCGAKVMRWEMIKKRNRKKNSF